MIVIRLCKPAWVSGTGMWGYVYVYELLYPSYIAAHWLDSQGGQSDPLYLVCQWGNGDRAGISGSVQFQDKKKVTIITRIVIQYRNNSK